MKDGQVEIYIVDFIGCDSMKEEIDVGKIEMGRQDSTYYNL